MPGNLELKGWLDIFWQFNLDLSVIVLTVLVVRFFIRKTTKSYNSYLLWLAIPVGFLVAKIIASIDFSGASSAYIGQAVSAMIVKPVETLQNYWWLGVLWLSGTTLLLLRLVIQHIELRKDLKQIQRPNSELPGHDLFISKHYQVIAVEHKTMSPAVYGFIRPKIYFPLHVANSLSVQQIQLIIEHEEQHIKQQHLWLNLLWDVLVCVGWFNPLIYIARKNFRHDQELFCDYLVLNKTDNSKTKDYGHALLSTVSATHSVSLLCSWKVFNQLEERIMNIKKPLNRKGKVALTLGTALVLSCSAIYAANKDNIKKEERLLKFTDGNGIVYVQENDNFYIEEEDQRRSMSAAERAEFEKRHADIGKKVILSNEELVNIEKEIDQAYRELELHQDDIEMVQVDIEKAHEELANAQEEIELELESGRLSREEMQRVKKQLARAKGQMMRDKENIRIDMKRVKRDLEKAKIQIREQHQRVAAAHPPHPPKAPRAERKSLTINKSETRDGSGNRSQVVKLVDDSGKIYVKSNGDYSVEVDGEKREITAEEKEFFDKKVKTVPKPPKPAKPAKPAKPESPLSPTGQQQSAYPEATMEHGIGNVNLSFDVGQHGEAKNTTVKDASAGGVFNKAAIDSVRQWKFAEKGYGKKSQVYKIKFALNDRDVVR